MNQNELTALADQYSGCNLLMPMSAQVQISPFYKCTFTQVTVDTSASSGDIYFLAKKEINKKWHELYGLSKPLLMKLATVAGIQMDKYYTTGDYVGEGFNVYKAKAHGAMLLPDGTTKNYCDEKVINLKDEETSLIIEFTDKAKFGITDKKQAEEASKIFRGTWSDGVNRWGNPCKIYHIDESDKQSYIERGVMVNMAQLRKTLPEKTLTGAILRVLRALIGVKGGYTKEELEKTFAVARVAFSPDYNDPEVRSAMLLQGMNSTKNLFANTPPPPQKIPPKELVEPEKAVEIEGFNPEEFADNAAFATDPVIIEEAEVIPSNICVGCGQATSPDMAEWAQHNLGKCVCRPCYDKGVR